MLSFSSPASPAEEERYNQWYERHVSEVMAAVPGVIGANRYKLDKTVTSGGRSSAHTCQYVCIYQLDAQTAAQMQAISDAIGAALADGKIDIDPALDRSTLQSSVALPAGTTISGDD